MRPRKTFRISETSSFAASYRTGLSFATLRSVFAMIVFLRDCLCCWTLGRHWCGSCTWTYGLIVHPVGAFYSTNCSGCGSPWRECARGRSKRLFPQSGQGALAVGEQLAGVLPWTELHKRQYSTPYSSSNDTTLRYIPIRVVKPDLLQAWRHWCYGFGAVSSSVLCWLHDHMIYKAFFNIFHILYSLSN